MMLGLTDISLLNDLMFLDYLTDHSHAFHYMTYLLQQLVDKRRPPKCARHMQLPGAWTEYSFGEIYYAFSGDKMNPANVFTSFSYHVH
eukprot:4137388-Karenia_brevis.AAC.1